jgi:hypothetical protein
MTPRRVRRLLALSFLGATLTAGTMLGSGIADADGIINNAEAAYVLA